jgi:RNA polymerase sigma factor (sigma-70 family)
VRGPKLVAPGEEYLLPVVQQAWHQRDELPDRPAAPFVQTRAHPTGQADRNAEKADAAWRQLKDLKQGSQAPLRQTASESAKGFEDRLTAAAQEGNMTAFGQFMQMHENRLLQVAASYVQNSADAEEVRAAAFVKIWGEIAKEDSEIYARCQEAEHPAAPLLYYVLTTIRNLSFNLLQKRKHRRADSLDAGHQEADSSVERYTSNFGLVPQDELLIRAETRAEFNRAFKKMQHDVQKILNETGDPVYTQIWNAHCTGDTPNEIAEMLNIPAGTVNSRLGRMRKKIEAAYGLIFLDVYKAAIERKREEGALSLHANGTLRIYDRARSEGSDENDDIHANPARNKLGRAKSRPTWRNPLAHFRTRKRNPACALTSNNTCALSGSAKQAKCCIERALERPNTHTAWVMRTEALVLSFQSDVSEIEHRWLVAEIFSKLA